MKTFSIKSQREIEIMRAGGKMLAEIVQKLASAVEVGITTQDLDELAQQLCVQYGVRSGTLNYHGYPKSVCISVNEELVHGIPNSSKVIADGDLVSVDMVIVHQGLYLDHAVTVQAGVQTESAQRLAEVTKQATLLAISKCTPFNKVGDISAVMQTVVEGAGYSVVRELTGHGLGYSMHEAPEIFCYGKPNTGMKLRSGMTLAVETMSLMGKSDIVTDEFDKWTIRSKDGKLTAHYEHTVLITDDGYEILTHAD